MEVHEKIMRIMREVMEEDAAEDFINDESWEWELDSLTFMQIVTLIEEEVGVELPDELLLFEGHETIDKLEAFIVGRMKVNAAN